MKLNVEKNPIKDFNPINFPNIIFINNIEYDEYSKFKHSFKIDENDCCAFCLCSKKDKLNECFTILDTSNCCKNKYILCYECILSRKTAEKCIYNCPDSFPNYYEFINYDCDNGTLV
jgi:hypothetical protein